MRGPTTLFLLVLLIMQFAASWLTYRLLLRFHLIKTGQPLVKVYWLLALGSILVLYSGRLFSLPAEAIQGWHASLVSAAYAWTIAQFIYTLFGGFVLAGTWLVKRLGHNRPTQTGAEALSRRQFLQLSAAALPLTSFASGVGGVYQAVAEMTVNRFTLSLPGLPAKAEGFTIVQISDLHVGPFFSLAKLDDVIGLVRQQQPDMVVLTGDFIDELKMADEAVGKMSRFAGEIPYGIYFCWGNHEYFHDINRIAALLKNSRIQVIDNSSRRIMDGEQPFYLLGVDYPWADKKEDLQAKRKAYLDQAMGGVPKEAFRLLLSHHPDFIENAFAAGIPLTLTGHTHGGQVVIGGKPLLPVQYKFMKGMYRQDDKYGYVHVGTGHWLPFRIGCPPEIAVFTLVSHTASAYR